MHQGTKQKESQGPIKFAELHLNVDVVQGICIVDLKEVAKVKEGEKPHQALYHCNGIGHGIQDQDVHHHHELCLSISGSAINGHQMCDNDEKEDFSEMKEMTVTTIIISDVTMTQGHDIGNCAVFESDDNHQ